MSFFHPSKEREEFTFEDFKYNYLDIQQIWLILRSGLCVGHWHFHGQSLESNLFAAFVSALFSFSRDMSSSTNKIRNMSFSELDIYYLPGPTEDDDKYFTAIAVNQGTSKEKTMKYLDFISNKFRQSFQEFILKTPAIIPSQFNSYHKAVKSFILINENISGSKYPFDLNFKFSFDSNIKKTQYQNDKLGILCEDNILRIFQTNPFELLNCFFIERGEIKNWYIDETTKLVVIISNDTNDFLSLCPLNTNNNEIVSIIPVPIEEAQWIIPNKQRPEIFYVISTNQYLTFNLDSKKWINEEPVILPTDFNLIFYHDNIDLIILIDKEGKVFGIERIEEVTNLSLVPTSIKVSNAWKGPKGSIYLTEEDGKVSISNLTSTPISLNSDLSNSKSILFTPKDDSILFISPEKIDIFDELGRLLVSYPLEGSGLSGVIEYNKREEENQLLLISETGTIEIFKGIIDRKRIYEQQQMYERKFDAIIKKISRISNSAKNITSSLEENTKNSKEIQNQINECKVYRQQLRNIIPTSLKTQTTLPIVFQKKIEKYEIEVKEIFISLDELQTKLVNRFEETKHREIKSLSSVDRIIDFIAKLRPRENVPVSDMANALDLDYQECLDVLYNLDNKKQLAGSLKEITKAGFIEKNFLFIKEDPELEKFSRRLSF